MHSLTSSLLSFPNISHGFFTREGGASEGIYASLNCGPGSGDDPAYVVENRNCVRDALGADSLTTCYQIHSNIAHVIPEPWELGAGKEGDALVTNAPGIAIGVLTADCVPVLLADRQAGVIGAAHAGWKGALAGIIHSTVTSMETLGATRDRIAAAIGPAIAQTSYEVGAEVRDRFVAAFPEAERCFSASGNESHFLFNLTQSVALRLNAEGVANVETLFYDTYADEKRFFSFRRATHRGESVYGRQISAICLRDKTI